MTAAPGRVVADVDLERYRLGELPEPQAEALRRELEGDASLRDRLAALESSDAAILRDHPSAVMGAAIRGRGDGEPTPRRGRSLPRPVLAWAVALTALVLATGVMLVRDRPRTNVTGDITRLKGLAPRLVVYRKRADGTAEVLAPGAPARAGDVVQLAYHAAGRRFGAIVSVDGRGVVTRHLPAGGSESAPLEAGPTMLAQAYRLDDAPRFERFYFLASDTPFPLSDLMVALRQLAGAPPEEAGRLHLPASIDQYAFVLRKETP